MFSITKVNGKKLLFTLPDGTNLLLVHGKQTFSGRLWNDSALFFGINFELPGEELEIIRNEFYRKENIHFKNNQIIIGKHKYDVYFIEIV